MGYHSMGYLRFDCNANNGVPTRNTHACWKYAVYVNVKSLPLYSMFLSSTSINDAQFHFYSVFPMKES
jgi:hypothetical protein